MFCILHDRWSDFVWKLNWSVTGASEIVSISSSLCRWHWFRCSSLVMGDIRSNLRCIFHNIEYITDGSLDIHASNKLSSDSIICPRRRYSEQFRKTRYSSMYLNFNFCRCGQTTIYIYCLFYEFQEEMTFKTDSNINVMENIMINFWHVVICSIKLSCMIFIAVFLRNKIGFVPCP